MSDEGFNDYRRWINDYTIDMDEDSYFRRALEEGERVRSQELRNLTCEYKVDYPEVEKDHEQVTDAIRELEKERITAMNALKDQQMQEMLRAEQIARYSPRNDRFTFESTPTDSGIDTIRQFLYEHEQRFEGLVERQPVPSELAQVFSERVLNDPIDDTNHDVNMIEDNDDDDQTSYLDRIGVK